MNSINQKTISKPINFKGIGLHSGLISEVKLIPSAENTGIIFKRVDLQKNNIIEANFKNVSSAILCTTLKNSSGVSVSTVEHLMAAFFITGIDNVIVEINNSEIPIMDGSSKDFINLINAAGTKNLYFKRKYLKILKSIEFRDEEKYISIEPSADQFDVDFQIVYKNDFIGDQKNLINFNEKETLEEVYTSRTFCLFDDIEMIKKNGLAKGGSLDNAIVVKNDKVLNEGGLRNQKEFVNHKILDLAGDFLLSGYRIIGSVKCIQGGHHLSNIFINKLFKNPANFKIINAPELNISDRNFKTPINKVAVNA